MPREITTVVRRDHTHWLCNKTTDEGRSVRCNRFNEMRFDYCDNCLIDRDVGDDAMNNDWVQIGTLIAKDIDGTETWEYKETLTNGT
ncbi:hypothetical protein NW762_006304 [Fusarium torreyae]|uniref:Uncharacterized protein n=1 Tax=Fusarium torreyae TaxID=1237075 RepID=A0A9W8S1D0_9HYPO|nr:hypothetical protein NW762_006304 [Fusarium torreyae]